MQHLQPNTTLQGGKYKIERVLGQGGFGITYLARNTVFDIDVAIKEFFMKDENRRDGSMVTIPHATKTELFLGQKEKFKKEASRMYAIKNEHVVAVHDLFEENGTAYYVMDYIYGESLSDRLKRTGRPFSEDEVCSFLPQILDALESIHDAGIWHLDLKPANIMVDKAGLVKLIDFGASKQLNAQKGGATTSTAISYTNGFAPHEQMEQNYDKFGPWTDIYALGATLYNLLSNKRPPMPTDIDDDRSEDKHLAMPLPSTISKNTKALILWMMKTNRNERPDSVQSIYEYIDKSEGANSVQKQETGKADSDITLVEDHHEQKPSAPKAISHEHTDIKEEHKVEIEEVEEHNGGTLKKICVFAVVVLCLIFGGYYLWNSNQTLHKGVVAGNDSEAVYVNTDSIWTVDEIPMPHLEDGARYVSNPDELLSEETEAAVNNVLRAIDDTFGIESAFVIVNHVENSDPKAFAFQLGNKYGIGRDNRGVVFVLAYRDKRYFMATGKALENELTDSICSIILDPMIPIPKEDNIDDSVLKMTSGLYYKLYDIFDN